MPEEERACVKVVLCILNKKCYESIIIQKDAFDYWPVNTGIIQQREFSVEMYDCVFTKGSLGINKGASEFLIL